MYYVTFNIFDPDSIKKAAIDANIRPKEMEIMAARLREWFNQNIGVENEPKRST